MAVRKWSIRHIRWLAAKSLVRVTPGLKRAVILYDRIVPAREAGETLARLDEEANLVFTPYERELVDRLPENVAWQKMPERLTREVRLLAFKDHTLLGDTGSLVDEARELLVIPRGMRDFATYHNFRPFPLLPVEKRDGIYVNMLGSWRGHRHLFHFLMDRFPRLYYLLERFAKADEALHLVVHKSMPAYQEDLYRFLLDRYPRLKLARIPITERWRFETLLHVETWQNVKSTLADPASLAFTRDLYLHGYGVDGARPERRLYVSREDTKKRRIRNETELREALSRRGIEPVLAARLSFAEQVRTFSQAGLVVGAHGAGLTNLLFSSPQARLLEIFPENKLRNTYFLLSRSQGQPYRYLVAGPAGGRELFDVDVAQVEREVEALEAMQPSAGPAS